MEVNTSMRDAVRKVNSQLECSICLDTFEQPKLLPCFHVFCKSPCLEKLVDKDRQSLTCPACRYTVPLSEKGVDGLQSDFHVARLFEIRDAFDKATKTTKTHCESCESGLATGYCEDCTEFVCDECQAAHRRVKVSKHHIIVTLKEFETQATNFIPSKKAIPTCPKHPENTLKIYCETCSNLICNDCTIRLHKDHDYDLVADVFHKHKKELVSSLAPVREKLATVEKAISALATKVKGINDQRATVEVEICKEADQLQKLVEQRRVELLSKVDMLCQSKLKTLTAQRDQIEITQMKLTSCLEYAEDGLQTGTEGQIMEMKVPVLKRIVEIAAEFHLDAADTNPETTVDLQLFTDGKEQMEKFCQNFLDVRSVSPLCMNNSFVTDEGSEVCGNEKKAMLFHALTRDNKQYEGKVNLIAELEHINSKERTQCEVINQSNGQYEISYQPVRRGKHKLHLTANENPVQGSPFPKIVIPSAKSLCKPTKLIPVSSKIMGTTINSRGQIIVIESNGSCVSVLTPDGGKIRTFGQLVGAYGVTVDKEDNIYIVENRKHRIQKFNPEGEFVTKTSAQSISSPELKYLVGICYNHHDSNLYVADNCNHRILVLSTDLEFVRSFGKKGSKDGEISNPYDIAFDDANNLYVTEWGNHRVQVLKTDGQFLKIFSQKNDSNKLYRPWAIAVDSSNTVYVSEFYCVNAFSSQGTFITTFGTKGSKNGQFEKIYGICVDRNDSVVVADCCNLRLQIY